MKPRILFLITEDWYFWSHRLPIARAARDAGFKVLIATRVHRHGGRIEKEGFKLIPLRLVRRNRNPVKILLDIIGIVKTYRREKPDIVHHVAVQPVLFGSLAAMISGKSAVVNALAGLGYVFVAQDLKTRLLRRVLLAAFKLVFCGKNVIGIFQNPDDLKVFVDFGVIKSEKAVLIRGAGVDPTLFAYRPEQTDIPVVLLASRMLWKKGIGEFVEASRILRRSGVECRMILVGIIDPESPASINEETLCKWHDEGVIEWWGRRDDMPEVFAGSNIVTLPTAYGEGIPKVLIEAASCGRAILTTDVPGCREIVRHNENGFLVPLHDSKALVDALKFLIENPEIRAKMGARGREIVEAEFSEEIVVRQTMEVYKKISFTRRRKAAKKKSG